MRLRLRSADQRVLALWVTGFVLAFVFLGWVIRLESERELRRSAQQAGERWAQLAAHTVPDLARALAGEGITPAARQQLLRLRGGSGAFRFKLFDAQGRRVLVSDDLAQPGALPPPSESDGIGHAPLDNARLGIRSKVLAGYVHSTVVRETRADRPAVYSSTYVPVMQEGKVLGAMEAYVDQTELADSIGDVVTRILAAVLLVLLITLVFAGRQFRRRMEMQRGEQDRVRYMAHHDALSGALNRASFTEVLHKAALRRAEGGPSFSLLCIDLDRFKDVNDSMGHAAGDEVLRLTTQRLTDAVREGDQVARLGGDEFAILLRGVASVEAVTPLAQRVVQALALPYDVQEQRVRCGGSVGIAIHGVDATEPDDLLGKADTALYRAKADGRGNYRFYDLAMDRLMLARRELAQDLRDAIAHDLLVLHYQPLYGSDGLLLIGYEALLRWQHPVLGNVRPAEFIALAEETGLIDTIGLWVLQRACRDAATWPAPLTVAVNLSAAQFASGDLVGTVTRALAAAGLEARRLELEIAESLLMNNTDTVLATLRTLAAMGVQIAMDDFGTGYSSLAYLWRFPFDKIKIDRAFTHNLQNDAKVGLIVRSIITLAHSLDIRVNAEGVETASQMAVLQELGCDELQGYLLGRPGPVQGLTHAGRALPDSAMARRPTRGSLFAGLALNLPLTQPAPLN